MKLLELYILRRILQMFLVALVPVLTIIWTIQVLGRINLVTDTGLFGQLVDHFRFN